MNLPSLPSKQMSQFQGASVFTVCGRAGKSGVYAYTPKPAAGYIFVARKLSSLESLKLVSAGVSTHAHARMHYRFSLFLLSPLLLWSFSMSCSLSEYSTVIFCVLFLVSCPTGAYFDHLDPPVALLFQPSHRRARRRLETPAHPCRRRIYQLTPRLLKQPDLFQERCPSGSNSRVSKGVEFNHPSKKYAFWSCFASDKRRGKYLGSGKKGEAS